MPPNNSDVNISATTNSINPTNNFTNAVVSNFTEPTGVINTTLANINRLCPDIKF